MRYPITLTPSAGFMVVQIPDLPGTNTQGEDEADAVTEAHDALETMLDHYFENNLPVPLPSKVKRGQAFVEVPASLTAKILLFNELLAQEVRPSELARRMNLPRQEMTRLLDPHTTTKIDTIALAFSALGRTLDLQIS